MYRYHISYYDPFPYLKDYATNDWDEVLSFLDKYNNIQVHIHNTIRNRASCPFCTES